MYILDTDHIGILQRKADSHYQEMDLRIASIALASGMTVLSHNLVDFQKVPNLSAEDWT